MAVIVPSPGRQTVLEPVLADSRHDHGNRGASRSTGVARASGICALIGGFVLGVAASSVQAADLPLPTNGEILCFAGSPAPGDQSTADEISGMTLSLEDGQYGYYFWFGVYFADQPGIDFAAGGTCRHDDEGFVCPIDGDGGWFFLEPASAGRIELRPDTGLRLEGPFGDEDDPAHYRGLPDSGGKVRHTLAPVPVSDCL